MCVWTGEGEGGVTCCIITYYFLHVLLFPLKVRVYFNRVKHIMLMCNVCDMLILIAYLFKNKFLYENQIYIAHDTTTSVSCNATEYHLIMRDHV